MKVNITIAGKTLELAFGTNARSAIQREIGSPLVALSTGQFDAILVTLISHGSKRTHITAKEAGDLLDKHYEQNGQVERLNMVVKLLFAYAKGLPPKEGQELVENLEEKFGEYISGTPLESDTSDT